MVKPVFVEFLAFIEIFPFEQVCHRESERYKMLSLPWSLTVYNARWKRFSRYLPTFWIHSFAPFICRFVLCRGLTAPLFKRQFGSCVNAYILTIIFASSFYAYRVWCRECLPMKSDYFLF